MIYNKYTKKMLVDNRTWRSIGLEFDPHQAHTQLYTHCALSFPRCGVSVFGLQAPGLSVRRVITALCTCEWYVCGRVNTVLVYTHTHILVYFTPLLVFLDLTFAFDAIDHGIIIG